MATGRTMKGPVLFIPNHCLHTDDAILLSRIPVGWRWTLSAAAAADTIYANPVRGMLASILANAFPLRRDARGSSSRGEVEVVFGAPLRFDADADPTAAPTRLEATVRTR
ncbi:MAG: hypothetical protein ABJC39_05455 [Chloroflexota bacterium]